MDTANGLQTDQSSEALAAALKARVLGDAVTTCMSCTKSLKLSRKGTPSCSLPEPIGCVIVKVVNTVFEGEAVQHIPLMELTDSAWFESHMKTPGDVPVPQSQADGNAQADKSTANEENAQAEERGASGADDSEVSADATNEGAPPAPFRIG